MKNLHFGLLMLLISTMLWILGINIIQQNGKIVLGLFLVFIGFLSSIVIIVKFPEIKILEKEEEKRR